jgi:hypothetical protein
MIPLGVHKNGQRTNRRYCWVSPRWFELECWQRRTLVWCLRLWPIGSIYPFRIRASSGKDQIDTIRETTTERKAKRKLGFSRVYLLLGKKPQRQLGDKEANSAETTKPLYADVVELVQGKSA